MDGKRCRGRQCAEQVPVAIIKQSVAAALVDKFQRAYAGILNDQRRTQDGPGDETGILIDILGKIGIRADIAHDLAGTGAYGFADNAG